MIAHFSFADMPLERAANARLDKRWYAAQIEHPERIIIPFFQGKVLIDHSQLVTVTSSMNWSRDLNVDNNELIFLGCNKIANDSPVFMIELTQEQYTLLQSLQSNNSLLLGLRQCIPILTNEEISIIGYGAALAYWHQSCQYCGFCGAQTALIESGHARQCKNENCHKLHFPRKDPVVIVLVEHVDDKGNKRCLLAGHKHIPPHVVSTLAGFVEHGETIEQAVAREVYEETRVSIANIRYITSQPWPFPCSLMLGFIATAQSDEFIIDEQELSSAAWFSPSEVRQCADWQESHEAATDGWQIPRKESIARYLIEYWLESTG